LESYEIKSVNGDWHLVGNNTDENVIVFQETKDQNKCYIY